MMRQQQQQQQQQQQHNNNNNNNNNNNSTDGDSGNAQESMNEFFSKFEYEEIMDSTDESCRDDCIDNDGRPDGGVRARRDMRRDEKYEVARTSREVCGGCAREEDERCYRDDAR